MNTIIVGTAANLLFGYQPVWNPNGQIASPFFVPPKQPLRPQNPVTTQSDFQYWSATPLITLHNSAQSLVSDIYKYDVLAVSNVPQNIDVPSGPLSLNDADSAAALAAAAAFLGLDFSGPGNYMLVTYERCVSTTSGDYTDGDASKDRRDILTAEAAAIVDALPKASEPVSGSPLYDSKLTLADAKKYLEAVGQLGTHFVTKVFNGDKLVQVFVYGDDEFKYLQTQFQIAATNQPDGSLAVSGILANSWAIYTSPRSGTEGFVKAYGKLTTISRDPALTGAVANGKWANGYVPDGTPSIFAASNNYSLFKALTVEVPFACQLTPLADLMPSALVEGPWDRLVAGGLMQKYGNEVVIPLRRPLNYDWAKIFPQTSDSWASGIVTPVIDIYQERVDLAQVKLMGAEIIGESYPLQSFSCFAQVLQASSAIGAPPIELPSDSITLVAQIIDTTQAHQTPVLVMSSNGLQQLTVACQDMYGALIFQSNGASTERKTALDGFLMETGGKPDPVTHRYTVDLAVVLTDPPSESVLEDLSQSVEFSVVAGESLLQAQGTDADIVRGLEVAYLNWLARIIPADTTDEVLANARVRALYLANSVATFGANTVFVPYVAYDSYTKYVNDLVTQAITLSGQIASYQNQLITTVSRFQVMTSISAVNDNVRAIGGVLVQYFQALADGRSSMDQYYQNIIDQLDTQLQNTLQNIVQLTQQLSEQQALISNLGSPPGVIQQFEKDYVDYEKDEVFKAVTGIVTGLFSLGVAFAGIPGAAAKGVLDALKALKDVYDKLQAVMLVVSQLSVIEKVAKNISKINELASSIQTASDAGDMQMPSLVDMQMIPNNVEAALANVPTNGKLQQDKANLIAAVKNLAIVGTALLSAQAQASQLLVEIANNQRLKTINGQQQAKMSALTNSLHLSNPGVPPDLAKIDLIGMTGQLQFQLKQVLSTMAKVLENQNGALQFSYFGDPVPITSFSLNQLLAVISNQDASIVNAIQNLNPQPQKVDGPITVKVSPIPYKEMINGSFKRISVHLSDPGFQNYVMVRIDRVVPRIIGVKSTASGNYEIALDTQAQPFTDRDLERQTRTFASTRRAFGPYVYDVKTGAAKFGTNIGTFADKVTHLTPFTDWNIGFPAKSTNKDIEFNDLLIDIELDFHITAIYNDPVAALRRTMMRALAARKVVPMAFLAGPQADIEKTVAAAIPDSSPTLAYLEGQMYQNQAVLNGWDAAFSMLSGPVNAFLNQQFQAYLKTLNPNNDNGLMTIQASYFGTPTPVRQFWISQVTELEIDLTNPLLQFIASSDQATVQQYIKGGSVKAGSVDVNGTASVDSTFIPGDASLPSGPLTFTVDLSTNELVISTPAVLGNGLGSIYLSSSGTLPSPLLPGNPTSFTNEYFIVGWSSAASKTRIKLSASADPGAAAIKLTDVGSGTQTLTLGVSWSAPAVVDTSKSPYVFANVQLSTIKGIVVPPEGQGDKDDTLTVTLDFPTGSFVLRNIHVDPPNWDPSKYATQISDAIANYYAQNEIKFNVQTINTKDLGSDKELTPTKFVLHAMNTNAGNNVLQLLMATTGKIQNLQSLALTEPVAYDPAAPIAGSSNFMISLMISSQLTFQHIFVDSFNRGSTNFEVVAVAPPKDYEAWSAKMQSGIVNAPVPFKESYQVDGHKTQFRISEQSNNLAWNISGLTFLRTQTDGIALSYSNGTANPPTGGTNVNFEYRQYLYMPGNQYFPGYWYWTNWKGASATAYVTMAGVYPLQVFNEGTNQVVKFSTTNPTVTVDKSSDLSPTGACECNDNDVKIALMSALSDAVPAQLQANMNQISFKALSIMALESLLFPANQLIAMSTAKVPAAALVVGSFLAQVRKPNAPYTVTVPASAGAMGSFGGVSFKSGTTINSATQSNIPAKFNFTYGPINPAIGGQVNYTIDIEKGTVNPPLIAVVYQPDTTTNPQNVTLLLPGYPIPAPGI
ncbi:hypothetical protein [Bradyrhizobium sp. Ash2021]|uniref:hypothetical protein n=1 Tax=Bradyrhizobium sp. Ash2021 TaxID=2954771 RepID=UPI00281659A5|nr:hypothetical protein [Bradyrhizobium sp. Ash2021]WMT76957.1 hypothetical protein NL528_11645 [Bradyrhizobium sp. Ash2021]